MKTSIFLQLLSITATLGILTPITARAQESRKAAKPNIILITTDDQGYADLSAFAHVSPSCETPNMDRIAEKGVLFSKAYVTAPVCSPSRAAMLTGRYQQRWDAEMFWAPGLPKNVKSLAEHLQQAGYQTGKVGKSDFGRNYHTTGVREFPIEHGYQFFFGFSAHAHDYFLLDDDIEERTPDPYGSSAALGRLYQDTSKISLQDAYATDVFTEQAIKFINKNHDRSFFLDLSYNAVHDLIHQVPSKYLKKWGVEEIPNYNPSYGKYSEYYWDYTQVNKISDEDMRKYYLANLNCLDDNIGRLLDALEKQGLMENTLIILVSDNGGEPLSGANNLPLSGSKYTMYEGGIRVPMLMAWPRTLPKNKQYSHRVSTLDIVPTCLQAAGIKIDESLDGSSLLTHIQKDIPSPLSKKPLFFRFGKQWAVIDDGWKLGLAENYNPKDRPITSQIQLGINSGTVALYHIDSDPAERHNLIRQEPERAQKLQRAYDEWLLHMQERRHEYVLEEKKTDFK